MDSLSCFVQVLRDCKGVIVLTGIGKSGFIAQKISMTLVSTGTRSIFLSPTDALHGDIGVLGPDDVLVLFRQGHSSSRTHHRHPPAVFCPARIRRTAPDHCMPRSSLGS